MRLTKKQTRWWHICELAKNFYNLDTEKDYFTLDGSELHRLYCLSVVINYRNSEPEAGRSDLRQLWYDLHDWNVSLDTPF